uniref:Putative terminase n=2 Tax=viral metagenome TaxID=1070528 RepID=A0A6M3XV30_9ZZZZ
MATVTKSPVDDDVQIIHSVYTDNPYTSDDYKKIIEDLATQDEGFYQVYALGLWGRLEGKIYTNYKVIPEMPLIEQGKAHWAYGLDFGDICSTLVKVTLFQDKIYLEEQFYKSGWTNADIIEFLSHIPRGDIYGDPTSKQAINEITQAGYSAFEGIRGVKESIDLCKRQTLYITQASTNIIKEIQVYHRKKNPLATGTEDAFLDEPVKFKDHTCDAFRYAIWGITSRFGFPTQRPRATEPIRSLTFDGSNESNKKILDKWMKRT